jgi:hypothetical protein
LIVAAKLHFRRDRFELLAAEVGGIRVRFCCGNHSS